MQDLSSFSRVGEDLAVALVNLHPVLLLAGHAAVAKNLAAEGSWQIIKITLVSKRDWKVEILP